MSKRTSSQTKTPSGFSQHELGRTIVRIVESLRFQGVDLADAFQGEQNPERTELKERCSSANVAVSLNRIQNEFRAHLVVPRAIPQVAAPAMGATDFERLLNSVNAIGQISETTAQAQAAARQEQLARDAVMETRITEQSTEIQNLTRLLNKKPRPAAVSNPVPTKLQANKSAPGPSGPANIGMKD